MYKRTFIVLFLLSGLLSACISLYKADIQQGNLIPQEMLEKLKPGLSKRQVRYLLGTPLIADPFHPDRWDYFYSLSRGGAAAERKRLTIYFKNDALETLGGDLAPAALTADPAAKPSSNAGSVRPAMTADAR